MAILVHLPKVRYKHNISTSDSEQNILKGDFACRIITFCRALKSFFKGHCSQHSKDCIWPSTFLAHSTFTVTFSKLLRHT